MKLEVISPGPFTTVQDGGRMGYQAFGVPVCGAMDWISLAAANILAGLAANNGPIILEK